MSIVITDEDIAEVEGRMGLTFDEESRGVIRCLETKDVQACPGSGKTTVLVAKLLILERKLPELNGRGICVLTHTNVAIDEIRERASAASPLFQEPSFCGTIQSFVDRFLAIPAYVHRFRRRPTYIDSDLYDRRMGLDYARLYRAGFRIYGGKFKKSPQDEAEDWKSVRARTENGQVVYKYGMGDRPFAKDPVTQRYEKIHKSKTALLEEGILHFEDAYLLAEDYLKKFPRLTQLFADRFAYVFIDEMQDTAGYQEAILNSLFEGRTVVQRLGDRNQRIFESSTSPGWIPRQGALTLSRSKRMSSTICASVRHVCLEPHEALGGHNRCGHKPVALVFGDHEVQDVLPAFGRLILERGLAVSPRPFKAVGRSGQVHEQGVHTLPSYFPPYEKPKSSGRQYTNRLQGHFTFPPSTRVQVYRTAILEALRGALYAAQVKAANGRYYSSRHMINYLRATAPDAAQELQARLVRWCSALRRGEDVLADIADYIVDEWLPLFGGSPNQQALARYITGPDEAQGSSQIPSGEIANTFVYQPTAEHPAIKIEVATVHSVKGETHAATLYLDTYVAQYDIARLVPRIVNADTEVPVSFLPVAYVAMTRPTDLLCIAVHKEGCHKAKNGITPEGARALVEAGWEVIDVSDLVEPQPTIPVRRNTSINA